jgi:hypothetical protein
MKKRIEKKKPTRKPKGKFEPEQQDELPFLKLSGGIFDKFEENLMELEEVYVETMDVFSAENMSFLSAWEQIALALNDMSIQVTENIATGLGGAFADAIVDGQNFGDAMIQIFKDITKQIIAAIAKQLILNALMGATGGVGILGKVVGDIMGGITSANDIAFGPSAGRYITGPEGTFSLNPNDSIVAGTDLFGNNQGNNNMTVNGYIDGSSIFLSNTRQTNTVNRLS